MVMFLVKTQLTFDLPYWRDQENDLWGLDCEFIELENPKNWQSKVKSTSEKDEMSRRGSAREAGMYDWKFKEACDIAGIETGEPKE